MKWIKKFNLFEGKDYLGFDKYKEPTPEEIQELIDSVKSYYFSNIKQVNYRLYISERLDRIKEINKFKKLTEPRARLLLDMKPFVRYEKEYDGYVGFLLRYQSNGIAESGYSVYKMKSKKGALYMVKGAEGDFSIYTQHFFDRYYQRVIDKSSKIPSDKLREKAIISFIKNIMIQHLTKVVGGNITKDNQVLLPYKDGFGLGYISGRDVFIKTFIDNEQAKETQLKSVEDFFKHSDNELNDFEPLKRKNK
jgi:hypothetical protein